MLKEKEVNITILILSLCIFMCGSSIGCKKCNSDGTSNTVVKDNFSSQYLGFVPFAGNEIIAYLKNQKDTIYFSGQGKNIYFDEVLRGGGDCMIKYRLLNHRVSFRTSDNNDITLHYYFYSETNAFEEYFEITFGEKFRISPKPVLELDNVSLVNISVMGKSYSGVLPLISNSDTIYCTGIDARQEYPRIKYQSNVYELLP